MEIPVKVETGRRITMAAKTGRFVQNSFLFAVALLIVSPAINSVQADVISLEFSGTYDTNGQTVFGLSGSAVPFDYTMTYDTSFNTNSLIIPAGAIIDGFTFGDSFYGYSASGITALNLTFGSQTWTAADIIRRQESFRSITTKASIVCGKDRSAGHRKEQRVGRDLDVPENHFPGSGGTPGAATITDLRNAARTIQEQSKRKVTPRAARVYQLIELTEPFSKRHHGLTVAQFYEIRSEREALRLHRAPRRRLNLWSRPTANGAALL
jgi:hypothetical protein